MESRFEKAVARLATYLKSQLGELPHQYRGSPAPAIGDKLFGYDRSEVDPFTTVCVDAFEGRIEPLLDAVDGNGYPDSYWIIHFESTGATQEIGRRVETPAMAATLRHALGIVRAFSREVAARVEGLSRQGATITLTYAGGGSCTVEPMEFADSTPFNTKKATRLYRGLRQYGSDIEERLRRFASLKDADLVSILDVDQAMLGSNIAFDEPERRKGRVEPHKRGYHVCPDPNGFALALQERWSLSGGPKLQLSQCQEGVARFLGARSWAVLKSISASKYQRPVRMQKVLRDNPEVYVYDRCYRTPVEGLAGLVDYADLHKPNYFAFSTPASPGSLYLNVGDSSEYVLLNSFMIEVSEDDDLPNFTYPDDDDLNGAEWEESIRDYLGVGMSRNEYRRSLDEEDNAISLEIDGVRIRRTMSENDGRAYLSVNVIQPDGSSVGYGDSKKASDAELRFDTLAHEFTIRSRTSQFNRDPKPLVTLSSRLTDEQYKTFEKIIGLHDGSLNRVDRIYVDGAPIRPSDLTDHWQGSQAQGAAS